MSSYTYELKLKIVNEYLTTNQGYKKLAKKYGIKNHKTIRQWADKYKQFGNEGLLPQKSTTSYPTEIKQKVIQLRLTTNLSNREIAKMLAIRDPSTVSEWYSAYQKSNSIDKLPKLKQSLEGEDCIMVDKRPEDLTLEDIKQLQLELKKAQFEVDYLKTLRSLLLEEDQKENSKNIKKHN